MTGANILALIYCTLIESSLYQCYRNCRFTLFVFVQINCRSRITEEFGPETVVSILKERSFYKDENFVLEACKALTSFISSEDDEVIKIHCFGPFTEYANYLLFCMVLC